MNKMVNLFNVLIKKISKYKLINKLFLIHLL